MENKTFILFAQTTNNGNYDRIVKVFTAKDDADALDKLSETEFLLLQENVYVIGQIRFLGGY